MAPKIAMCNPWKPNIVALYGQKKKKVLADVIKLKTLSWIILNVITSVPIRGRQRYDRRQCKDRIERFEDAGLNIGVM